MLGLAKRPWRSLCDGDIASELVAMMESLQNADVGAIARHAHLSENEVAASPFGLRAVAMGVATGATHVHRELTRVPSWEGDARMAGDDHDEWRSGVLKTGKYQAFIQDGAHSLFDPSHVAKWGPHEMMHRSCGFFWREDASSFELYVGARLNELLPVALWYGADQIARLQETNFVRHRSGHEVERATWRDAGTDVLADLARRGAERLRWFTSYLDTELRAIDGEIQSGSRVITPVEVGGATLNASSDALAYTLAHRPRLQRPAVAGVLRNTPAHHRIGDYREHIESQIEELLFGELAIDGAVENAGARNHWHESLAGAVGGPECAAADGVHGLDLGQLAEGIERTLPGAFEWLETHGGTWLETFAESTHLWRRAPLATRLSDFVDDVLPASPCGALVCLGGAWSAAKSDARVEELSDDEGELLVRNQSAIELAFDFDVLAHLDAETPPSSKSGDATSVLVVSRRGEVLTLGLDDALQGFWADLGAGPVSMKGAVVAIGKERVDSLLEAGALARFRGF